MLKKAAAGRAEPRERCCKDFREPMRSQEVGRQEDKLSRPHWHSGTITASRPAESSALPRGSALSWGGPQMARPTSVWLATPELWVTRCQLIRSAIMFYFGARETAENQENYKTLQCYFAKNINCKVGFVLFFFLNQLSFGWFGVFQCTKNKIKKKKTWIQKSD